RVRLANELLDLGSQIGMLAQVRLGVFPTLAQADGTVREPGPALLHDVGGHGEVNQLAFAVDAAGRAEADVEFGVTERRRALVLDHHDANPVADDLVSVLHRPGSPDVETHARVELEGTPSGRRLGVAKHHADLFADLVGEDETGPGPAHDARELAEGLTHEAGL